MGRKYRLTTVVLLVLTGLIGLLLTPYQASALDYALIPLRQLEEESDVIVTGTVLRERKSGTYNVYTLRADQILKGGMDVGTPVEINVIQFADEGKMSRGERYLLLLKAGNPFIVSGVHQGLIQLSGGKPYSRFYKPDDITGLLDKLGAKHKEVSSAEPSLLPPENASPSPDSSGAGIQPSERTAPGSWEERKPPKPFVLSEWYGPLFLAAGLAAGTIIAFAAETRARKQQPERDSHAPD